MKYISEGKLYMYMYANLAVHFYNLEGLYSSYEVCFPPSPKEG
jgi:hypothetical protein